jgi:hypothetical protein
LWRLRRYHPNTMSSWLPSEAGNTSRASARLLYVNSMSCVCCLLRTAKWLNCLPSTFLQLLSLSLDIRTIISLVSNLYYSGFADNKCETNANDYSRSVR